MLMKDHSLNQREGESSKTENYKVNALYDHVHNYKRACPIYQNICTSKEKNKNKGSLNGTIHVVAGGGGY
ncbi:hypothetical protein AgCh_017945 [Apium graveolens]